MSMKVSLLPIVVVMASGLLATQAGAVAINEPPPAGPVILDLNGTSVPHVYTPYTTSFVATSATTNLSFAFREDPAFLNLANVTMATGGGPNLLTNGDFSLGPVGAQAPTDWTYLNIFGATFGGIVSNNCGPTGGNCYLDGAVQAYDAITQSVATTAGATYVVNFQLDDTGTGGLTTFSALSTNGDTTDIHGNGGDLLVYAGALPTPAVPEPASLALFGVGLACLGVMRRWRVA